MPPLQHRIVAANWPKRWIARFALLLALYLAVFAVVATPMALLGWLGGSFTVVDPIVWSVLAALVHSAFAKAGRNVWTNRDPIIDDDGQAGGPELTPRSGFFSPR